MKNARQEKIIEIIRDNAVETQEELAGLLIESGFSVTQATVSRDIKQMNLIKVTDRQSGRQRYAVHVNETKGLTEKYGRVFKDGVVNIDTAMNILVIKTVSGMANAVAAALDSMQIDSIVGTVAGDDTIMCAIRTVRDAQELKDDLVSQLGL